MKLVTTLSIVCSLFFLTSCEKQEILNPIPSDDLTVYTGTLTYQPATGSPIINLSGTGTLSSNGATYTIAFSDNVPSISGLIFVKTEDGFVSAGTDGSTTGVSLKDGELKVGSSNDGNNWAFTGSK